jgi:hypothetical protein
MLSTQLLRRQRVMSHMFDRKTFDRKTLDPKTYDRGTPDRRTFLIHSALALAGITAGTFTPLEAIVNVRSKREFLQVGSTAPAVAAQDLVAGFGWEINDINNNGADIFFEVLDSMVLNAMHIDVAFMLTSPPAQPGFAEVLCMGGVSRGAKPTFSDPPATYINLPATSNFGRIGQNNPNKLNTGLGGVVQDLFYSVILKSWVPADGTASSTSRNVSVQPGLLLSKGDFLVFHMDHAGVGGDVEMQATLQYTLS